MSKRIPIFLSIILICIAVWLLLTPNKLVQGFIERLSNFGYDLQLRTRILTEHLTPTSPIVIIDIDDKSLEAEGRWPWPRSKLAELVNQLQNQGSAIIVFDMFFSEKEKNIAAMVMETLKEKNLLSSAIADALKKNTLLFDEDALFAKSLPANQTVLAFGFLPRVQTENLLPPPILVLTPKERQQLDIIKPLGYISNIPILEQAAKYSGFINIYPDSDGIIRRTPLILEYQGNIYPALSLQAVLLFLGEKITLVTPSYKNVKKLEGLQFGNHSISTDSKGQVLIPFIGKSYTFPYYSATDVLNNRLPKDVLHGKIVFVGTSATGENDIQPTAVQNPFPGVEIQATLVNGMLTDKFSYIPAWTQGANLILTILFGLIAACLFPYFGPRGLTIIIMLFPLSMLFINNMIWRSTGLILSFLMPVVLILAIAFLNIIYGYLFETRRREKLNDLFGQYVPKKHIDEMLKTKSNYGLYGEDREMSVLFADIRNFTMISEGLSASELVDMLNTFFTPMTEIIFNHRGTIDKYIGDLIMSFWGAPLKDKNHAQHAIESALQMQKKLKRMQSVFVERKWPEIKIGIGINSGTMSVGDMGSRFRLNYTVMGDAVNLASRIEGLTKFYGVDIIVTESTKKNQKKFVFRKLDQVQVKGKSKGISIYEVIDKQNNLTPELKNELVLYHKALNYYFEQQWELAFALIYQLHQIYPDKKLYLLYLDRIKEFKENPPPADWNGIYVHVTK